MTEPRQATRPSRRKRLSMTLAAAAAGFVIVFEFLALQLQNGHDPALGGGSQAANVASAPAHGGSSAVVTRSSGGVQSVPVSTAGTQPAAAATTAHRNAHHSIRTGTSGATSVPVGEDDDLG